MGFRNGCLSEPLPVAEVSDVRIAHEAQKILDGAAMLPRVSSPLLKQLKPAVFQRQYGALTVEQAFARAPDIFSSGIESAEIEITANDIRELATKVGNDATPGIVEDVCKDARLFYGWIQEVISDIATGHFDSTKVRVVLSVPNLDVPLEQEDAATLVIHRKNEWNEEKEEYQQFTNILDIPWPGRHAIAKEWSAYIVILMRLICKLTD